MFSKEKFMSFYNGTPNAKGASSCYDNIRKALEEVGILTDLTLIGALATARIEVGRAFLPIAENPLWAVEYEFRTDLGNVKIGDGIKYRGRGYIQLTGRDNYIEYGMKLGVDLLIYPKLALDPVIAAKILARYFKGRAINIACNEENWILVRKLVNGGTNGLTAFIDIINQYIIKNMTSKLEITKVEAVGEKTVVSYHRFDTDGEVVTDKTTGTWEFDGTLDNDAVLEKAKTMVDDYIEVSLNLTV